ncbi:hypothetical protein WCT67_04730 [Pectobacterium parvum]|uniref:hypothetical protein n=1 Tax=Pectobacterium parvum TaxID=2778550 RepID=UPI00301A717A
MTTQTSASLPEWLDVLREEFGLTFDHVSDESLKTLWSRVQKIHEEWLQSRDKG